MLKFMEVNLGYILLFLFSSNFLDLGNLFIFLLLLNVLYPRFKIKWNGMVYLFILFIVFFLLGEIFNGRFSIKSFYYYAVLPMFGLIIGQNIIDSKRTVDKEIVDLQIYKTFLAIIIGLFFHGFLNSYYHSKAGNQLLYTESLIDVWTGESQSRISQSLFFSPIASVIFISLSTKKILLTLMGLSSIYYSIIIGNRTVLVIVFLSNIIVTLYISIRKEGVKYFVLKTSQLLILLLFFIGAYSQNIFGIKSIFEKSYLYYRIIFLQENIINTARFDYYLFFIRNFKSFLLGKDFSGVHHNFYPNYLHNTWLDIFYFNGFFSFVLFSVLTILWLRLVRSITDMYDLRLSRFFITVIFSFLLQFSVEPILQANPYYMTMFYILIFTIHTSTNYIKNYKL